MPTRLPKRDFAMTLNDRAAVEEALKAGEKNALAEEQAQTKTSRSSGIPDEKSNPAAVAPVRN